MAGARHSRGFVRGAGVRRQTAWDNGPGGTAITQLSASGASLVGGAASSSVEGLTLVRTRGILAVSLSAVTSPGDGFFGAVGIGIATLAAVTAGIGSLPTPITEASDENWVWHQYFSIHATEAVIGEGAGDHQSIEIDSKAMRKAPVGTACYAAIEVVEIGTGVLDVFLNTRQLFKLS